MKWVMLSYGRPDLQITLQKMPRKLLGQIEMMVVPSEYKAYKSGWFANKVKSIECWPKEIDCAPKKRKWAALNLKDDYMLMDDDISLYVWSEREQKFVPPAAEPRQFEREFMENIPQLFKEFPGVSLGNKFMADPWVRANGKMKVDNVGFVVSGFAKNAPRRELLYNRVFAFTDISLPLQMYQLTGKSLIYYGLCYNHSANKKLESTGMATYRDDFVKMDSAVKMARMFPGIVTGMKDTGNKGGGITLTKFFSRVRKGVSENNLKASEEFIRTTCMAHGLVRVPKLFEYEDDMPRAEIIQLFKQNWEAAKKRKSK